MHLGGRKLGIIASENAREIFLQRGAERFADGGLVPRAKLVAQKGLRVRACYMGGGTPTALNGEQLARVLDMAKRLFPGAREWTVEAGRPDLIQMAEMAEPSAGLPSAAHL